MREILQIACGYTIPRDTLALYSEHSPRHFLNEVGRARNEPPGCRHELGRWSMSVAQLDDLRPVAGFSKTHDARLGNLPDRYSQDSVKLRPVTIIQRQMAAVRKLVSATSDSVAGFLAVFSRFGGWEQLEQFHKTGGDYEE